MLIASGYVAILLMYGWVVAVYVLRMRHALGIAGMTVSFGTASYLVFANALAYIMDVRMAFWAGLVVLFCITALVLVWAYRTRSLVIPRSAFILPPRWLVLSLFLLISLSGLMGARFLGSDPEAWIHFPLASTIADGNFPVVEVVNPWDRLGYHYGQAFLAAAFTALTGLPLVVGYGFQPLIGIAGVLLFAGALVWALTRSWRAAFVGAVLALFGGGIMWVKIVWLLRDLLRFFMENGTMVAPFKYLTLSFGSSIVIPIINAIGWRTFATGSPLFFGLLYALHEAFIEPERKRYVLWGAVCIVLASALALTMEGSFLLFYPALFLYIVLLYFLQRRWTGKQLHKSWMDAALLSVGIFAIALFIARFQGGTLSARGGNVNASAFSLWFNGQTEYHTAGYRVAFWQWPFLRDFGLPLFLVPLLVVYFWKRRATSTFPLFLLILALGHLAAPFVVHYNALPGEMKRLFTHAISLFAMLAGIVLEQTLLSSTVLIRRIAGYVAIGMMVFAGALYASVRLLFPTFRFESAPLFAHMPSITDQQRALYVWVRTHSTIRDYFYLYTTDDTRADSLFTTKSEKQVQQIDRIRFMTYTGRFTIGMIQWYNAMSDARWALIRRFERTCRANVADVLQIRYLVVETADRARWFRSRCAPTAWDSVYDPVPGSGFPRIYERSHN